jgi:hypothetical protein
LIVREKLEKGGLLAAPNVLDYSIGGSLAIYMRGDPNTYAEVEIYDESGELIGILHALLDSSGHGKVTIEGGLVDGRRLGPGMYWALVKGNGVNAKKRFMVVPGRRR